MRLCKSACQEKKKVERVQDHFAVVADNIKLACHGVALKWAHRCTFTFTAAVTAIDKIVVLIVVFDLVAAIISSSTPVLFPIPDKMITSISRPPFQSCHLRIMGTL